MITIRASATVALLTLATAGCGLFSAGPGATSTAFYRHLEKGEIEAARQMLSSGFVAQLGEQKVRSALEQGAREISEKNGIKSIDIEREDVQGELATVSVRVTYGNDSNDTQNLKLSKENGEWKITPSK